MRNALRLGAGAVCSAVVALACAVPAVPAATASVARFRGPGSGCSPAGVVSSLSRGSYDSLYGVSSLGSSDVWAVGRYVNSPGEDRTLIEHWGGRSFGQVPSPDPKPNDLLYGVDAVTSADVWAVGATFPATVDVSSTLIEHWNGTAWSAVPSPPLSSGSGTLGAVAGDSPDDIWAVGTLLSGVTDTQESTLAEHWDGSTWQVVPTPDPGRFGNALASVAVLSPDDVWAVGSYYYTEFGTKTLIEHWNGRAWQVVSSPDADIDDGLVSVSAVSASDIWAVGDYFNNTSTGSQVLTLAEHFDGTRWAVAATPSPDSDNDLLAVKAVSRKDVWAVGGSGGPAPALVEHWNGTAWQVAQEPYRHGNANYLYALSASRSPGVWATGSFGGSGSETLAEHFCTP
jgi:hypothetical protein